MMKSFAQEVAYCLLSGFILALAVFAEKSKYQWKESKDWLPCSVTCGKGIQMKEIFCTIQINDTFIRIPKDKCQFILEPKVNIITCHRSKCPKHFEWKANEWSSCSQSCGHLGFKTRDVDCLDMNDDSVDAIIDESLCDKRMKPIARSICNRLDCKASFVTGKWGKCKGAHKCKPGKQYRQIKCSKILADGTTKTVSDVNCLRRGLSLPPKSRQCFHPRSNEQCYSVIPSRKVTFNTVNNNLYQMRRTKIVPLHIGQIGYLFPFSRVVVECSIDEFPLHEIKWTHQNISIKYDGKTSRRIRVDKTGKLRIKQLIFEDQGEWKCWADISYKSVIIKIRSPSSGFRDWAIRSNLWKIGMLSEEAVGVKNAEEVIHWVKSEWSICSVTCSGDGTQYREVQCERVKHKTYEILEDSQCERVLKTYPLRIRACHNSVKCPQWHINQSNQYQCLKDCIDIGMGTLEIDLKCIYLQQEVPLHMCDRSKRPFLQCQNDICQLDWRLSPWSKCSKSCGGVGIQARYITCVWKHSRKSARSLCYDKKLPTPSVVRKCITKPCIMGCVDLSSMCAGNSHTCYHGLYRYLCCLTCQKYFKRLSYK